MSKQIVIMPGGFHPFHAGHMALYNSARQAFPDADLYVAATNSQEERPFPFAVKEKLAKVAGVEPGHFIQVKSPFQAKEITQNYNPEQDVLIFVRSEKDKNESPKPGGTKKDGSPAYFQPWTGKDVQPFGKHAYFAYLPTVKFGPGITSATEIRKAWPTLNDKRKTAMVMSLYPAAQKNQKLAANIVAMLDQVMGGQEVVAEGLDEAVGDNYLYHATQPSGMMRILRSGAIKASYRPQEATKARTQSPTVSTTRSKQYAESDDFVNFLNLTKEGNSVIIVFDRSAVANHYKMFSTSQGTQTVGDEFEEVIVVPKGAMPIQGTMKGFYFNPKRTVEIEEFKDTPWFKELLNSPYYMGQKPGVAEGFSNDMSTQDMIAYLRQHHDKNLHSDYVNHVINTNSKFVLKNIPLTSIRTELSGLDRAKVEQYKKMDFSKAPPIVIGSDGNILDGYHRATVAKALNIPSIKAYVGIKGQQDVEEAKKKRRKKSSRPMGGYFFPGYAYYGGSGEYGDGGGGGESVAEGVNDYLWHGSKSQHDILYPQQANDTGGKEESNKNAIYATPNAKVAIAMGLTTPGSDTGMFPNDPQMVLFKGGIRKGEMIYLHKVPKDLFIKHNNREWYSKPDVKEITPIEIKKIPVDKYLNLIRTATPHDLELQKKYMKKQGVTEGSQSKDDLIWTLNNFDYYTDNGSVYVNDNGDKIARIGSNWKHQSGKMGSGAEELSAFLNSLQDVNEGFGINYPSTHEQENNMFKGHGQRRIGDLTNETSLSESTDYLEEK